jgi:hypothetical protein
MTRNNGNDRAEQLYHEIRKLVTSSGTWFHWDGSADGILKFSSNENAKTVEIGGPFPRTESHTGLPDWREAGRIRRALRAQFGEDVFATIESEDDRVILLVGLQRRRQESEEPQLAPEPRQEMQAAPDAMWERLSPAELDAELRAAGVTPETLTFRMGFRVALRMVKGRAERAGLDSMVEEIAQIESEIS